MAETAAEIFKRWQRKDGIPPMVPKEDVVRVVDAFFPNQYELREDVGQFKATRKVKSGTSHFLCIQDDLLRQADQFGCLACPGGVVPIPHCSGKHVRKPYVEKLVKAIELKLQIAAMVKERETR